MLKSGSGDTSTSCTEQAEIRKKQIDMMTKKGLELISVLQQQPFFCVRFIPV